MFLHNARAAAPARSRLERIVGSGGSPILVSLFERANYGAGGVDAKHFRIDFRDQRQTTLELAKAGFIATVWEPAERYRLTLVALSPIDTTRARSLLAFVDRHLRYLEVQSEAERDQEISVAPIGTDLQFPQRTLD